MDNEATKEFEKVTDEMADGHIEKTADEINAENAALSTGSVRDDGGASVFYTASQVKAMTPAQVRANYDRIIESMKCRTFFG